MVTTTVLEIDFSLNSQNEEHVVITIIIARKRRVLAC